MSSLRLKLQDINQKLDSHGSGGNLRDNIDEMTSLEQSLEPKAHVLKTRALQVASLMKLDVKINGELVQPIKTKLANSCTALDSFFEVWSTNPLNSRQSPEFPSFNRTYSILDSPLTALFDEAWMNWVELTKAKFLILDAILVNSVPRSNEQQSNISEYNRFLGRFEELTANIPTSTHQIEELNSVIAKLIGLHDAIIADPGVNLPPIVEKFYNEADTFHGRGFQFDQFTDELWSWLKENAEDLHEYTIKRR